MEYIYPDYYKEFKCIADKCPDTCCAGWKIMIDDKSLEKYRKVKGGFGNRLANCIDWKDKSFCQDGRRCAFLNEDNLCDIYAEVGKDMLCKTCRRYPRHYEEFENVRELSLSLSCPVAAKIILGQKSIPKLLTEQKDLPEEEYEYFDFLLYAKLLELRDLYFDVLNNSEYSLEYKMCFLLATSHDVQTRINQDKLYEIDELINKYRAPDFYNKAVKAFDKYRGTCKDFRNARRDVFDNLFFLEVLNGEWTPFIKNCREKLYNGDVNDYFYGKGRFKKQYVKVEQEYLNLLHYYIYVYMVGAVYDEDVYTKIRFAVVNVLNIMELDYAKWLISNEMFDIEMQTELVYRYSREVEHSDLNLSHMEKLISKGKEFSYVELLHALL